MDDRLSPSRAYAAYRARTAEADTPLGRFAARLEYALDPFQESACRTLQQGRSVLVAARPYSTPTAAEPTIPQTAPKQDTEIAEAPARDVVTADVVSGAPSTFPYSPYSPRHSPLRWANALIFTEELRHRAVRIFQPTRSTTQSGSGKSNRWRIDWDILPGGGRWENPLMGWASS